MARRSTTASVARAGHSFGAKETLNDNEVIRQSVVTLYRSRRASKRRSAAHSLGVHGKSSSLAREALFRALSDRSRAVRTQAAQSLLWHAPLPLGDLLEIRSCLLTSPSSKIVHLLLSTIRTTVKGRHQHLSPWVKKQVLATLSSYRGDLRVCRRMRCINRYSRSNTSSVIAVTAMQALGEFGPDAADLIAESLDCIVAGKESKKRRAVGKACLESLVSVGRTPGWIADILLSCLSIPELTDHAIRAIISLEEGSGDFFVHFQALLKDPEAEPYWKSVIEGLGYIDAPPDAVVDAMLPYAVSDSKFRLPAMRTLMRVEESTSTKLTPVIQQALASKDQALRMEMLKAVGGMGEHSLIFLPDMLAGLNDSSEVCVATLQGIAQLGEHAVSLMPDVTELMFRDDPEICAAAREALIAMGCEGLDVFTEDDDNFYYGDEEQSRIAFVTIGEAA